MSQGTRDQRDVRALAEKWLSVHHDSGKWLNLVALSTQMRIDPQSHFFAF